MAGALDVFLHTPDTPPPTPSPTKKIARPLLSNVSKLKDNPHTHIGLPPAAPSFRKRRHGTLDTIASDTPVAKRRSKRQAALESDYKSDRPAPTAPIPSPPSSPCDPIKMYKKREKRKMARPYADPSIYAHLPQYLGDLIAPNLTLLLVGLNPGVMTAQTGFHFANPTNLFWPLLYSSGIITRPMKAAESASLISEFDIGITNIVKRPTAEGGELSKDECVAGAANLVQLVCEYKPRAIALTGKGIWDAMFRHLHGRTIKKSDEFKFGWQDEVIEMDIGPSGGSAYECRIFVTMGTSGRVAAYSPAYKREVFKELGDWVNGERAMTAGCREIKSEHRDQVKIEAVEDNLGTAIEEEDIKKLPQVVLYDDETSPFF